MSAPKEYKLRLTEGEVGLLFGLLIAACREDPEMGLLFDHLRDSLRALSERILRERAQAASRGA